MFCDDTRDAVKGSALKVRKPGFINGAEDKEDDIIRGVAAWQTAGGESAFTDHYLCICP